MASHEHPCRLEGAIMRKRFFAASVIAVLAFGALHAEAAPITSGSASTNCSDSTLCFAHFSAVPNGQFLMVNNVSCAAETKEFSPKFLYLTMSSTSGGYTNGRYVFLQFSLIAQGSGNFNASVNNQINFKIGSGKFPLVSLNTFAQSASTFLQCTIIGTLSTQ